LSSAQTAGFGSFWFPLSGTAVEKSATEVVSNEGRFDAGPFYLVEITSMEVRKKHWTTTVGQAAGHPAAFAIVLLYGVLWLTFDAATFDWNAVATLAVWVMTLFIQRSNRRDTLALHAKLDELLRVDSDARSELTRLDEQEPEDIEEHRDTEVQKTETTN
jgi:low affinity Fe/Cu permease